jgi:hypothetical protein
MEEPRMTKEEFEGVIREWAKEARSDMRSILRAKTHGKGELSKISVTVGEDKKTTSHYAGFKILRYGVFVAYGVGRGWIRHNGTVMRGSRVKKYSENWFQMRKKGYSTVEIKNHAVIGGGAKERKPVDWFDSVIVKKISLLADVASDYYGDFAMGKMLEMLNRATIRKNYTSSDIL